MDEDYMFINSHMVTVCFSLISPLSCLVYFPSLYHFVFLIHVPSLLMVVIQEILLFMSSV